MGRRVSAWVGGCLHGWVGACMVGGWVSAWVGGCLHGWVGGCLHWWVGACIGGWVPPWVGEWEVFKCELSPYPTSLFGSDCLMREANKQKLADALSKLGLCDAEVNDLHSRKYVIDGGDLQKIVWEKHKTFEEICNQYLEFL